MNRRNRTRISAVLLALVLVLTLVGGLLSATNETGPDQGDADAGSVVAPGQTILPGPTAAPGPPAPTSGLPTVTVADLPAEGLDTLLLIDGGGPFPYDRDGITFFNREGLLPAQPEGYYREFTVPTPGESDRGARRLVVGAGGEVYYTDDHYGSFREVVGG